MSTAVQPQLLASRTRLRHAGGRFWAESAGFAVLFLVALGVPSVLLPNTLFVRMVEAPWWSYAIWGATAVLGGLVVAARRRFAASCPIEGRATAGGVLSFLAVACPTCNALVVAAIGTSGAMAYFAPLQPVLGLAGVAILLAALGRVLRVANPG